MLNTQTLNVIATVLADAEAYLAGKPITIDLPSESFEISGVKVTIPALSITLSK